MSEATETEAGRPKIGRYRVLEVLGSGGMADVYLALIAGAFDAKKLVVLKRPRVGRDYVNMFLDEARLAMRLNHPNVVQTNDVGVQDGALFLAMEYLEGQPLDRIAKAMNDRGEHLHHAELARIAADALAGLHYAHELRDFDGTPLDIVHRDVSPHNLFVTYEGQVKLVDFGIAKATMNQVETSDGSVKGKFAYMSPEHANGKPLDGRADVFAIGVILWELVARRRLFAGASSLESLRRLDTMEFPRLSAEVPGVDPRLEVAVARALERDPEQRFPSARAMRDALEEYIAASGHAVRASELGAFVGGLFAGEREERALAIQAHMLARDASGRDVAASSPPPPLEETQSTVVDAAVARNRPSISAATPLAAETAPTPPPRARVGLALVVTALVTLVSALVSRREGTNLSPATDGSTSPSSSAAPAEPPCTSNHACTAALGVPAVCRARDHRCGRLLSPECPRVVGDAASDDAIVIGSIFTTTGTNGPSGQVRQNAADLAVNDIKVNVEGVRSKDAKPRPLALVVCDDRDDSIRPATHLVEDVGVPAIVGVASSSRAMEVATRVTIPAGVLLFATASTSPILTSLPDRSLVWRTSPSDTLQAIALVDQLGAAEVRYRAENAVPPSTNLRIAFVYINDAYGLGLYEAVAMSARLNGKALADPASSGLSKGYGYEANPRDLDAHVAAILGQSPPPAILVGFGSTEIVTMVMAPLEKRWPAGVPRPQWLVADAMRKPELLELSSAAGETIRKRVRGTTPSPDSASKNYKSFVFKYEGLFGAPAPATFGMPGTYDAIFLLAYAAAAAGPRPITGDELQKGLRRLSAGPRIDVGGANMNAGFAAIGSAEGTLDFDGASGPLDFDPETGEARSNIEVWCIGKNGAGQPAFSPSGRLFDAATGRMVGEARCQ